MNAHAKVAIGHSVCPHDCPSTCALDVELLGGNRIGRVHGARDNSYTAGVICAKVARYAERIHHPDRLMHPAAPQGPQGRRQAGQFERISWDDALDITAEAMLAAERRHGAEAVWPYYYAGTMGLVMRDGINRLRHAKRYSSMYATICTTLAWTGFIAGTGRLAGADPREMAKSDLVVIWGTNPVNTQVNVMTHATRARKERGAKIVAVDIYRNGTMQQADLALCLRPGTDGALACAVMHVLFRDGHANWPYLEKYTDCPRELEAHLRDAHAGMGERHHRPAASPRSRPSRRMVGTTPRTYFRLGYGFARSRNGAHNMHAALCIPAVTGAWQHEGGGAFHNNGAIYHWNRSLIEGLDVVDPSVRVLDQSRIGPVLTGDPADIGDGPPVTALLIQNTNPVQVAPEQRKVKAGFAREDLFACVHEQFMTATAEMADVVLPATMFLEHDDIYQGGGHQHIMLGPKLVEPPGECRSNHEVICELARRVGAEHRGFAMSPREIIDWTLQKSGWGTLAELEAAKWIDCQPDVRQGALHRAASPTRTGGSASSRTGQNVPAPRANGIRVAADMPGLPDHWDVVEKADARHPFRLATSPAREYLNSSFNEMPTSRREARAAARQGAPRRPGARSASPTARACAWATSAARSCSRPRPSTACSAASSSSRASPPTSISRAARASTR